LRGNSIGTREWIARSGPFGFRIARVGIRRQPAGPAAGLPHMPRVVMRGGSGQGVEENLREFNHLL
jgi:hypothetical protein